MRICIVTIAGPVHGIGGMQDHTRDLAEELVRQGHEVQVITSRHPDGRDAMLEHGVEWEFVDARGHHMDKAWLSKSVEAFRASNRRRPFDVVHGEGSSALGLVRAGVPDEVPVVTMFHGNFLGLARAGVARARRGRTIRGILKEGKEFVVLCGQHFPKGNWYRFRGCEAIVPAHQQRTATCLSHFLKPSRVHVVPNGVDVEVFRPRDKAATRRELGLPAGAPILVGVGRLNYEKGFHHAVRALALAGGEAGDAQLVLVGDGAEREALVTLAGELGVAQRVRLVGAQPALGVAKYLAAADVFLFPTEREEAAPLVLPQAMACALPVIASRRGGITEVVDRPGENGLLVAAGDVEQLRASLVRLLAAPALRERLGAAARLRVLEEYTLQRMAERTLNVYGVAQARSAGKRGS
jgi:glycosyltransferase involved in cell wall biosynthesis